MSSKGKQSSLLSFFGGASNSTTATAAPQTPTSARSSSTRTPSSAKAGSQQDSKESTSKNQYPAGAFQTPTRDIAPITRPSSILKPPSIASALISTPSSATSNDTPSRTTVSLEEEQKILADGHSGRKRKQVNYAESTGDDDDDDDEDAPISSVLQKQSKKGKKRVIHFEDDEEEEEYIPDQEELQKTTDTDNADDETMEQDGVIDDDDAAVDGGYDEQKSISPIRNTHRNNSSAAVRRVVPAKKSTTPKRLTTTHHTPLSNKQQAQHRAKALNMNLVDDDDDNGNRKTSPSHTDSPSKKSQSSDSGGKYDNSFLLPGNLRDANGVPVGAANYNPRTVYVPPHLKKHMTPAQKQYWDIKSQHFDTVLLFKIGKFYEMFDMDADIGVKELGLNYMVNSVRPHSGFPEAAYDKYCAMLVKLGYKVGRVEQTQTPKELAEANKTKQHGQKEKVVERTLCSISTQGTLTDPELIGSAQAHYLLVIRERTLSHKEISEKKTTGFVLPLGGDVCCEYGVCFFDAGTAAVHIGQFYDDAARAQLSTLLGMVDPTELCYPKDNLSSRTVEILRNECAQAFNNAWDLQDGTEFYSAEMTFNLLGERGYFKQPKSKDDAQQDAAVKQEPNDDSEEMVDVWPDVLNTLAEQSAELAFSALGGALFVLSTTMKDQHILQQRRFHLYSPTQAGLTAEYLVLDNQTLINLEVIKDSEGNAAGSLLHYVDQCVSGMGHRLMKQWLIQPLASISAINDRLSAIEWLMAHEQQREELTTLFKPLKHIDLERLLSILHAHSMKKAKTETMYGNVEQKKLEQFMMILKTLDQLSYIPTRVFAAFTAAQLNSQLLIQCTKRYPEYSDILESFRQFADLEEAKKEGGLIKPRPGADPDYDAAQAQLQAAQQALQAYLHDIRRLLKDPSIQYKHMNKDRYTLEMSVQTSKRQAVGEDFTLCSSTKTMHRYITDELRLHLIPALEEAELQMEKIEKDCTRKMYAQFVSYKEIWQQVVHHVATLDCLCSLAKVSMQQQAYSHAVRPVFAEFDAEKGASLEIRECVHPVLVKTGLPQGRTFIPNDTVIGTAENPPRFVLVSGPNMGGKSTLLRQTCCAVILAQLGCYVPASECRLTPVDRIFTRVGANDKIMTGQSTFLVELNETATIVRHASPRSLVILDELGRGTSTFDGTAIAYSVVQYLSKQIGCLCLFSTHYHMLMEEFANDNKIAMYHMACAIQQSTTNATGTTTIPTANDSSVAADVAFLYQFKAGVCPKSYGLNVARLAALPAQIIARAHEMSEQFERRLEAAHGKGKDKNKETETTVQQHHLELSALLAALAECELADNDAASRPDAVDEVV